MSDRLAKRAPTLPANVLADRVVGRLREAEKALQQATTIHQAKLVADVASAQEVFAHRQRLGADVEGYAYQIKIIALARLGELIQAAKQAGQFQTVAGKPGPGRGHKKTVSLVGTVLSEVVDYKTAETAQQLAALPRVTQQEIANRERTLPAVLREKKRDTVRAALDDISAQEVKEASGVYDVLVIDPPWPIKKIERDLYPNQVELDYPTMSEPEILALDVAGRCAPDTHVWLWTTQRFLPLAFRALEQWQLNYVCTFVWHKPGGFQPMGLPQYNCEFALYARRGTPVFLDDKTFFTCFDAPRAGHSEKPEEFYELVRRVTGGRRLDWFNRRSIEGFEGCGKEAVA